MTIGLFSVPSTVDIYDIKETFSQYYVDPSVAQQNVHPKWKVKIHDNGKAVLQLAVQECGKVVLDSVLNVGRVGFCHIWIELEGPHEVITPLPGTTRSLPTWYWYVIPHQLDNRLASACLKLAGVPAQTVKKVSLGGELVAGTRIGEVIESDQPDVKYNWTETSKLYPEPDIVTGSHRFRRKQGRREWEAHVKCFTHFLADSQVSLKATPDSAIGKLGFGAQLTGTSNPVWVRHCHVSYRAGYF